MNEQGEKLTVTEAMDMLTVGEIGVIEKHFGCNFDDLSGITTTSAVIWAHERRRPVLPDKAQFSWSELNGWTLKQLNDYFAPEPVEVDEDAPDSDSGKGASPAA